MANFPLSIIPNNTKINFIEKSSYAFCFSIVLSVAVILLLLIGGLNYGIDFTGGMIFDINSSKQFEIDTLRKALDDNNVNATIQESDSRDVIIRIRVVESEDKDVTEKVKSLIIKTVPEVKFNKIDYVGPKVGNALIQKAMVAVFISLVCIMLYIAIRFDWYFAIGITLALFHDALITLGFYIITRYEFDLTSIAALLTVIGYSVNDSVVIYDRIRENLAKYKHKAVSEIINLSLNETLSRTIMTVLTTLLVCLALVIFGGPSLRGFSAAMFFGIAFGTYSSIYISAPILILIEKIFKVNIRK